MATMKGSRGTAPPFLPILLALYDALNDDDDEIRDEAADAASSILGTPLVAMEAVNSLLRWMTNHFGHLEEFKVETVCRMIGSSSRSGTLAPAGSPPPSLGGSGEPTANSTPLLLHRWTPAEAQLARALTSDDALFFVEEQNLFIEEVRETVRWADIAFRSLRWNNTGPADGSSSPPPPPPLLALESWATQGLRALIRLLITDSTTSITTSIGDGGGESGGSDGPLGWTSKPAVFAICARVLLSARALGTGGHDGTGDIARLLGEFRAAGEDPRVRVHGLLLSMAEI